MRARTNTCAPTYYNTNTRTCTHIHTHAHTYTHLHIKLTYTHKHAHTHTHTHTYKQTHKQTHKHTHTRTHTNTETHTHFPLSSLRSSNPFAPSSTAPRATTPPSSKAQRPAVNVRSCPPQTADSWRSLGLCKTLCPARRQRMRTTHPSTPCNPSCPPCVVWRASAAPIPQSCSQMHTRSANS